MLDVDTILQSICPGLFAAADKNAYVFLATQRTSQQFYGDNYSYAIALKAAHNWTLVQNRPNGEAGSVSAEHENGQSVAFNKGAQSEDAWDQTWFGLELKQLRKGSAPLMNIVKGQLTPIVPINFFGGTRW